MHMDMLEPNLKLLLNMDYKQAFLFYSHLQYLHEDNYHETLLERSMFCIKELKTHFYS